MTAMTERFPALSRHWQVLRESWRAQDLADKAFSPREQHEFLPAALEVIETPPSPAGRRLLWLTCGLFVLALIWAVFGKVDIVTVAPGKIVPGDNIKLVQAAEIGSVRAIHVRNGQFVRQGQLLIELDPTLADADESQNAQALVSAQVLQARNDALLSYIEGRGAAFVPPPGMPEAAVQTERSFVRAAVAQYEAQRAALLQQAAERRAEAAGARAQLAKLRESLPYLDRQMAARAELAEKGYYSRLKLLEFEQARAEHTRDIEVQTARAAGAAAAVGRIDAELRNLRENFGKSAVTDLVQANDKAGLATEDLRKSARRRQLQQLRSPIDGVVQQIAVNTVGGVVQPAQPLMVIVPCRASGARASTCSENLAVEALVQNRDIGFIRAGQRVAIKLDAFNFTEFGLLEGTVETISADAINSDQAVAGEQESGGPLSAGSTYATRVTLRCQPSEPGRSPLCSRLQPGMAAQVEIKTGRRRIIHYLLSPIRQRATEAGRER